MLDLFETIFIWFIYLVAPTILIIHFFGPWRAGLLLIGCLVCFSPTSGVERSIQTPSVQEVVKTNISNSSQLGLSINGGGNLPSLNKRKMMMKDSRSLDTPRNSAQNPSPNYSPGLPDGPSVRSTPSSGSGNVTEMEEVIWT